MRGTGSVGAAFACASSDASRCGSMGLGSGACVAAAAACGAAAGAAGASRWLPRIHPDEETEENARETERDRVAFHGFPDHKGSDTRSDSNLRIQGQTP